MDAGEEHARKKVKTTDWFHTFGLQPDPTNDHVRASASVDARHSPEVYSRSSPTCNTNSHRAYTASTWEGQCTQEESDKSDTTTQHLQVFAICPDASTADVGEIEAQVLRILSEAGEMQAFECNGDRIDNARLLTAEIHRLGAEVQRLRARVMELEQLVEVKATGKRKRGSPE